MQDNESETRHRWAAALERIASVLDVPVCQIYAGADDTIADIERVIASSEAQAVALVQAFASIRDRSLREECLDFVRSASAREALQRDVLRREALRRAAGPHPIADGN